MRQSKLSIEILSPVAIIFPIALKGLFNLCDFIMNAVRS